MSAAANIKFTVEQAVVEKVSKKITAITGVQLGEKQETMVLTRLNRRLTELGLKDFEEYQSYFDKNETQELNSLVSLMTTHHTFFFREFSQFEQLLQTLPSLVQKAKEQGRKRLDIWCAACSTGQEVYTIAMFLEKHLPIISSDMSYRILASDVDPQSVAKAKNGVYRWNEVQKIPQMYLSGNWLKGTGDISDFAKVRNHLKEKCEFKTANIIKLDSSLGSQKFDLIFCRNVFIYFTTDQINLTVKNFKKHLTDQGLILTGLSESLATKELNLNHAGRSIYGLPQLTAVKSDKVQSASPKVAPAQEKPLRVLCVDDSPTVHTILKKILQGHGFEIVGSAKDGLEAQEMIHKVEFDVMTLDIHMPKMNGVEYLKNTWTPDHPPVVMVSSVAANDSDLALSALDSGAFDYVEKPSLQNLSLCSDEIRAKLKSAAQMHALSGAPSHELAREFSETKSIPHPEKKSRSIFCRTSELKKLKVVLAESSKPQPPTFIFLECPENMVPGVAKELRKDSTFIIKDAEKDQELEVNSIYLTTLSKYRDFESHFKKLD